MARDNTMTPIERKNRSFIQAPFEEGQRWSTSGGTTTGKLNSGQSKSKETPRAVADKSKVP